MGRIKSDNLVIKSLLLIVTSLASLSMLQSCGKTAVVATSASTTKLCIVDASPDVLPVYIYIGNLQLGTKTFTYPTVSNYYSIFSGEQVFQVRNHNQSTFIAIDSTLLNNRNYTLFITGLATATTHADTLSYIFTTDYSPIPDLGKGKIRFVNASPRTAGLDVYANDTKAFSNIAYKGVTPYIQVPAGAYSFSINATATPANQIDKPLSVTVQDGRLYTIFTRGLVGRADSAAITTNVIAN